MVGFLVAVLIAVAISIVSYVITPKPKAPKPEAAKELESPTASADREVMVPFGTMTIKSPNALWSGDKAMRTYKVKV